MAFPPVRSRSSRRLCVRWKKTMSNGFFPPRPASRPTISAYEDTQYAGLVKVGYTPLDAQIRVAQQYPTKRPGKPPYRIVLEERAMRNDGTVFTDRDIHRMLRLNGVKNPDGEWFRCTVDRDRKSTRLNSSHT